MIINVKRNKIVKDHVNRVTSHLIFEKYKRQTKRYYFDPDGIFSNKIFGKFYKCSCGALHHEGWCEECGDRVVMPDNLPDYYIDLKIEVPVAFLDYSGFDNPADIEGLLNYNKFLYDGEIYDFSIDNEELNNIDYDKILIGRDAAIALGVDKEWLDENLVDYISIPHPIYRPLIHTNNNQLPFITDINKLYTSLVYEIQSINSYENEADIQSPIYKLIRGNAINDLYQEIIENLYKEIATNKFSLLKNEVIAHPISGAIRGVLTNRHDLDEDVLLIGDTLVKTLWPYLYKLHEGNMVKINEELINRNYFVLINRPPTICHLSIMAMKPRIASLYPYGKTEGTLNGLLQNTKYINEMGEDHWTKYLDQEGDIEQSGQLPDSEDDYAIDTLGIRCLGMNPIAFDGLAADTDGDCLLVIALYSKDALAQAENILPSHSYMNYANGTIRNHIIEDFMYPDITNEG